MEACRRVEARRRVEACRRRVEACRHRVEACRRVEASEGPWVIEAHFRVWTEGGVKVVATAASRSVNVKLRRQIHREMIA